MIVYAEGMLCSFMTDQAFCKRVSTGRSVLEACSNLTHVSMG